MAQISTSILNHHYSYPCMFNNNIGLTKKSIRTSCSTTPYYSSSVNIKSIEERSPWLMLPSREAKTKDNTSQLHTLYDRCFYDLENETFVPPPTKPNSSTSNLENHLQDLADDVRCIGASHGWLAFLDPSDCSLYLCNPLNYHQIIQLPPIETLKAFAGAIYRKLDDGSFKTTGFILKGCDCDHEHEEHLATFKTIAAYFVDKIILTSSPIEKDCIVVLSAHSPLTTLAICKIGDDKWTNLDEADGCFSDVSFINKENKVYAKPNAEDSELEIWDLSDSSSPKKTILKYSEFCHPKLEKMYEWSMRKKAMSRHYLVESSGKLLMVRRNFAFQVSEDGKQILSSKDKKSCRYPYKTLRFDVFEFDEEDNKFKYVRDLGDMALFLGINHSIAMDAREVPGIKPNAIYFGDYYNYMEVYNLFDHEVPYTMFGGHDFGIYNVEDDSMISPCYPTESKEFVHPPVWFVS